MKLANVIIFKCHLVQKEKEKLSRVKMDVEIQVEQILQHPSSSPGDLLFKEITFKGNKVRHKLRWAWWRKGRGQGCADHSRYGMGGGQGMGKGEVCGHMPCPFLHWEHPWAAGHAGGSGQGVGVAGYVWACVADWTCGRGVWHLARCVWHVDGSVGMCLRCGGPTGLDTGCDQTPGSGSAGWWRSVVLHGHFASINILGTGLCLLWQAHGITLPFAPLTHYLPDILFGAVLKCPGRT